MYGAQRQASTVTMIGGGVLPRIPMELYLISAFQLASEPFTGDHDHEHLDGTQRTPGRPHHP